MGTKLSKRAYIKLIEEDLEYLNVTCKEHAPEKEHIRAVLRSSIDRIYPEQSNGAKSKRECPYCGSVRIMMFDADNDICNKCGRYFPGT